MDVSLTSEVYRTAADIYSQLYEYEEANKAFIKSANLRDSIALDQKVLQQELQKQKSALADTEKETRLYLIQGELKDLAIARLQTEKERQALEIDNLKLSNEQNAKDLELARQSEQIKETNLKNQVLETERTQQLLLLAQRQLDIQTKERQVLELEQAEELSQRELERKEAQLVQEEQRVSILENEKTIQELELNRQKERTAAATRLGLLLFLVSALILAGLIFARRTNRLLNEQKLIIEEEQQKSESLLHNMLPVGIAKELKEKGKTVPRRFENVSILFSDFVGFTTISARNTPETILHELNDCFKGFDAIMEGEGVEKIQTVGDGYLAVACIPEEKPDHAHRCVRAAEKMIQFLAERNKHHEIQWEVRIGIHSGPMTAGVIGTKKLAYNIFGDTVNTAARIETAGAKGRINVSSTTYHHIKDDYACEYRGKISAKGKGELDMYFVLL